MHTFGREAKEKIKQLAKDEGYKIVDNGGYIADAQRQCVNSIIQGSAADMTKIAMIRIHDNKRLQELGYKLIIPVHDEVLGVCPKENAKEVRDILEYIMVHVVDGKFEIPMKTDIDMFKWLVENNLPVLVIATKTDKISKMAIQKHLNEIKKALGVDNMDILPYSSAKNVGRAELLDVIGNSLLE